MKQRFGFLSRLLIVSFALIAGAISALGYIGLKMILNFAEEQFNERTQFVAENLARNCELGLLIEDQRMLQRLAANMLSDATVVSVIIKNSRGQVLASAQRKYNGVVTTRSASVRLSTLGELPILTGAQDKSSGSGVIGSVHITFGLEHIRTLHRELAWSFVFIATGIVVVALVCFFFFARSLLTPIARLAQTADAVARGDHDVRAPLSHIPEARALAEAFNAMLDSLEWNRQALEDAYHEMMRQKTFAEMGRLAMVVAHEVKNPLGIIKSSLDLLKNELHVDKNNVLIEYMEDEIRRLNRLIEEFLLFSKPIKPSFANTDLNRLAKDTLDRHQLQVGSTSLEIRAEISDNAAYANVDRDLLVRAMGNLIKNAMDASDGEGIITVRTFEDGTKWTFSVDDQGPGVDPSVAHKIFDPVFTTRATGTGLGLAFVAQVVRTHRGEVYFENLTPRGARFTITLPLTEAPSAAEGAGTRPSETEE